MATEQPTPEDQSEWSTELGRTLGAILGEQGRTRKWLAQQIGIDPATSSRMVAGLLPINVDQLARMAQALGVTRRSVLTRAGYIEMSEDEIDLSALSPDGRDAVLGTYQGVLAGARRRQRAGDSVAEDSQPS